MDLNSIRSSPVITDSVLPNAPCLGSSYVLQISQPIRTYSTAMYRKNSWSKTSSGSDDENHSNPWVDVSIPVIMSSKMANVGSSLKQATHEANSGAYQIWLKSYPSALTSFSQIASQASGKQIALFLDYDGTLSPIVSNPDRAFMSTEMRAVIKSAAKYFPTAIISGRSRHKVSEFVQLTELYYAGSHGMDIMGPARKAESSSGQSSCMSATYIKGKEVNLFQPAREFLPIINEVFKSLFEIAKDFKGSKVESNKFCLSVHYRLVDPKAWVAIEERVKKKLAEYPSLRLSYGRKVLEIRPDIDWNKGKAVKFLLESLGLHNCDNVLPIYLGDDQTDEDAFKALRELNQGFGIVVTDKPKVSQAFYSLHDTNEVLIFLQSLVKWKCSQLPA